MDTLARHPLAANLLMLMCILAGIWGLPADLETPIVRQAIYYETVAAILLSGDGPLSDLVQEARRVQRELLDRGLDQVELRGVPREEIAIQVDSQTLYELGVPLHEIAASILRNSRDISAGTVGSGASERALRAPAQRPSAQAFAAFTPVYG